MQIQQTNIQPTQQWRYSQLSQRFKDVVQQAMKHPNPLCSCNKTAQILKDSYIKISQELIQSGKLKYHKKEFKPEKCRNSLFKEIGLEDQLRKADMIRFPLHDLSHNYDHYVTIFREKDSLLDKDKKNIWILVHSWENVYSLKNWVYDVDIQVISRDLREQEFDPISHLRDFLGYFNEKWFYEFYKDKQHEKHNIFPRFQEIYSFNSNDHRRVRQIQWYTLQQ